MQVSHVSYIIDRDLFFLFICSIPVHEEIEIQFLLVVHPFPVVSSSSSLFPFSLPLFVTHVEMWWHHHFILKPKSQRTHNMLLARYTTLSRTRGDPNNAQDSAIHKTVGEGRRIDLYIKVKESWRVREREKLLEWMADTDGVKNEEGVGGGDQLLCSDFM